MRILIGADHGGFEMKELLRQRLASAGHDVVDKGACEYDGSDDYPDFALAVARGVAAGEGPKGIVVCGSGVGASVAASKIKGVRAAVCHDTYSARQGVEHDDMNVLCLGGRVIGEEPAKEIVDAFVGAEFSGGERHKRRLGKVLAAEAEG